MSEPCPAILRSTWTGTPASAMDFNDLTSAARTMSLNDFQSGAPLGEGAPKDRNVELLLPDPR